MATRTRSQNRRRPASKPAPEPEAEDPFAEEAEDTGAADDGLPEVFDLSEVPDQPAFEVLPPGIYDGVIEEVRYGESQSSGNPMLTWILQLDVVGEDDTVRQRTQWYHTTLAGNGLSRTKRTLMRLDPELELSDFRPAEANEMFEGLAIRAKVGVQPDREDPKQKRNNVRELMAADEDELD